MQAFGLIETKGLLAAIVCADVMLKTAQVELVERTFVGGGLVTITITGEVTAVKASVEAGAAIVDAICCRTLLSQHVIPRPHNDIESILTIQSDNTSNSTILEVMEPQIFTEGESLSVQGTSPEPCITSETTTLSNPVISTPAIDQSENSELSSITVWPKDPHKEEVDELVRQFGQDRKSVV